MENSKPYREFGDFLRKYFLIKCKRYQSMPALPVRTATGRGFGGCTYCNNQTFSRILPYRKKCNGTTGSRRSLFSRKYPEMKYLAYFQAYTNTYDELDSLISKYEEALACPDVVGLIVGTRPDCMPDTLLDYFSALSQKVRDNRIWPGEHAGPYFNPYQPGTYTCRIREAIRHTAAQVLYTGAHLILGLPGESRERDITPCRHSVRPSAPQH